MSSVRSARELQFNFIDDLIFVADRPLQQYGDVDSIAKRGFRSVICVNEHLRDSSTIDLGGAFASKHVQYLSAQAPLTDLIEMANGHVEKFDKDFNESKFDKVVSLMDVAPRPTLVVSFMPGSNQAALGLVYAYIGTRLTKVNGVKNLTPDLRDFVETYVNTKINRILARQPTQKYEGGIWAAAQPTADDLKRYAALGAKSVLNIRDRSEAGKVGLGVLLQEPQICSDLNMDYFCVPVANGNDDTIANRAEAVGEALKIAPKPVVFHCATRGRIDKLVAALHLKPYVEAAPAVVASVMPATTPVPALAK